TTLLPALRRRLRLAPGGWLAIRLEEIADLPCAASATIAEVVSVLRFRKAQTREPAHYGREGGRPALPGGADT
ncbi:hypothetical protein, partial [Methylobacterium sp. GXF4]|uniref:hypothetical protein n=1 Tax=Methylobacterium sp. GXF4 TaxID=1096546 RepID=UPI001AEC378D